MKYIRTLSNKDRVQYISSTTGIAQADVRAMVEASQLFETNCIMQGLGFKVGKNYTIYPELHHSHKIWNMQTKKLSQSRPHYALSINTHRFMQEALKFLNRKLTK